MFRILSASVIASVTSHRIQLNNELDDQSQLQSDFGASCADLETMFHNRLTVFQSVLDAQADLHEVGRATQVRLLMRSYGIVRTLRRARTCSWVAENDGDIAQMRDIVQTFLDANPCAEAARAELEASVSDETSEIDFESLQRSMSILLSDNCEVMEVSEEQVDFTAEDLDAQLIEAENELQDNIDDLADASESGGAFIQFDGRFSGFLRRLSVAFIFLILLLACAGTAAVIGGFLFYIVVGVLAEITGFGDWTFDTFRLPLSAIFFAGPIGGGVGLVKCSRQLYTQLLPRVAQRFND